MQDGADRDTSSKLPGKMTSTPEILRKALAAFENPAGGPCPSDIYQAQYWEMAGAHACLMNGLLSIYEVSKGRVL